MPRVRQCNEYKSRARCAQLPHGPRIECAPRVSPASPRHCAASSLRIASRAAKVAFFDAARSLSRRTERMSSSQTEVRDAHGWLLGVIRRQLDIRSRARMSRCCSPRQSCGVAFREARARHAVLFTLLDDCTPIAACSRHYIDISRTTFDFGDFFSVSRKFRANSLFAVIKVVIKVNESEFPSKSVAHLPRHNAIRKSRFWESIRLKCALGWIRVEQRNNLKIFKCIQFGDAHFAIAHFARLRNVKHLISGALFAMSRRSVIATCFQLGLPRKRLQPFGPPEPTRQSRSSRT